MVLPNQFSAWQGKRNVSLFYFYTDNPPAAKLYRVTNLGFNKHRSGTP